MIALCYTNKTGSNRRGSIPQLSSNIDSTAPMVITMIFATMTRGDAGRSKAGSFPKFSSWVVLKQHLNDLLLRLPNHEPHK